MKRFLKNLLKLKLKLFNNIKIDKTSLISLQTFKLILKKKYAILSVIKNSELMGNIDIGNGSEIVSSIIFGDVIIGNNCSLSGPGIKIGSRINKVIIKDFTSIGANTVIQEDNHNFKRVTTYFVANKFFNLDSQKDVFSKGDILIEEDVWIGSNVSILSGVNIGRGSIIGAGSVVTKNIPPYSIVVGNPAKVIKRRFNEEKINYLEKIEWWKWDYEKIKKSRELFLKEL